MLFNLTYIPECAVLELICYQLLTHVLNAWCRSCKLIALFLYRRLYRWYKIHLFSKKLASHHCSQFHRICSDREETLFGVSGTFLGFVFPVLYDDDIHRVISRKVGRTARVSLLRANIQLRCFSPHQFSTRESVNRPIHPFSKSGLSLFLNNSLENPFNGNSPITLKRTQPVSFTFLSLPNHTRNFCGCKRILASSPW